MGKLIWLMMLGLVMALAVSCVEEKTAPPTPPPGGEIGQRLKQMALQLSDVPEGLTKSAEGYTTADVSGYDMATLVYGRTIQSSYQGSLIRWRQLGSPDSADKATNVIAAQKVVDAAKAKLNQLVNPSQAELDAAQRSVAKAESNLAKERATAQAAITRLDATYDALAKAAQKCPHALTVVKGQDAPTASSCSTWQGQTSDERLANQHAYEIARDGAIPGTVIGVQSNVVLFGNADQAEESFALMKKLSPTLVNNTDNPIVSAEVSDVKMLPAPLGDDSFAYQGIVKTRPDRPDLPDVAVTVVAVHRGQLVGVVIVQATMSPAPESLVSDLVRKMDTRLQQSVSNR